MMLFFETYFDWKQTKDGERKTQRGEFRKGSDLGQKEREKGRNTQRRLSLPARM
jgi:hypothetical protein